jgi:hypothetical protein
MSRPALAALVILSLLALAAANDARPWMNRADPPAVRAQKLLAQMTIDEKIVMLHGPPSASRIRPVLQLRISRAITEEYAMHM